MFDLRYEMEAINRKSIDFQDAKPLGNAKRGELRSKVKVILDCQQSHSRVSDVLSTLIYHLRPIGDFQIWRLYLHC